MAETGGPLAHVHGEREVHAVVETAEDPDADNESGQLGCEKWIGKRNGR